MFAEFKTGQKKSLQNFGTVTDNHFQIGSSSNFEGLEGLVHFLGMEFPILPIYFWSYVIFFSMELFVVGDQRSIFMYVSWPVDLIVQLCFPVGGRETGACWLQ